MLLLGEGLQKCLSSHLRACKTAGGIHTSSLPTWTFLGNAGRIPKARMGFCRNNLIHYPLQSIAVFSNIRACWPWHALQSLLSPTDVLANCPTQAGADILVNKSPNSSIMGNHVQQLLLRGCPCSSSRCPLLGCHTCMGTLNRQVSTASPGSNPGEGTHVLGP